MSITISLLGRWMVRMGTLQPHRVLIATNCELNFNPFTLRDVSFISDTIYFTHSGNKTL